MIGDHNQRCITKEEFEEQKKEDYSRNVKPKIYYNV